MYIYIHCVSKKVCPLMFVIITLANVDQFSKFFHHLLRKKIFSIQITKISPSPAVCCYTTLWSQKKSKNVTEFDSTSTDCWPQQTVDMFLRTLWRLDLTFNCSHTDVSRLLTLTDWLTFWSLSDDVLNQQLNVVQLNVVAWWCFFTMMIYLRTVFVLSRLWFVCRKHS